MERIRITVEEVAADPTNAFEITMDGDREIKSLRIVDNWVAVVYASGGTCTGCPKHWASYVRYDEELMTVHSFYPEAVPLVLAGWTTHNAIDHVTGMCDHTICTGDH